LYAGEGESRKPDDTATPAALQQMDDGKPPGVLMKGHEFVQITFHMPASCDSCAKTLWAPFRPPPAVECKRESSRDDLIASLEVGHGTVEN
jgi:Rho-associated protein kinase 2